MSFDFPTSPSENQEFTPAGGPTYVYKNPRWTVKGLDVVLVTISDTAPTARHGQMWWQSSTGNLFVYYNDGTSSQWVQINTVGT